MRFFNTEGPVRPDDHYGIPPLERMDVEELLGLIRGKRYFVLHAPRQTGKTSALIALRDLLNSGEVGNFRCVNVNVEVGQVARDDTARGMRSILSSLADSALLLGDDYPAGVWLNVSGRHGAGERSQGVAHPLVCGEPGAAGAAGRRDRLPGRRHPALGAAPAPRRLPATPGGLPAERGAVRGARHPRLPHPVQCRRGHRRRQPLQRRGEVVAHGRLHRGGDAGADGAAHRGDRPAILPGGAGGGVDADPRPAVAGERAVRGGVLRQQGRAGPLAFHRGGRRLRGAGGVDSLAAHAPGPVGAQAGGGAGTAGGRAPPERRGGPARRPRPGVPARSGVAGVGLAAAHREPDLPGGGAARAGLRVAGQPGHPGEMVRARRRRLEHDEAADGVRHLLRGARGALARPSGAVPGGGAAAHLAVVPATGGERGRTHRAGVRVGAGQDGPAGAVAAGVGAALGPVGAVRGGVQGVAGLGPQGSRVDGGEGRGADVGVHEAVRGGRRASGGDGPSHRREGAQEQRGHGGPRGRRGRSGWNSTRSSSC